MRGLKGGADQVSCYNQTKIERPLTGQPCHNLISIARHVKEPPIDDAGGVPRELTRFFGIALDWKSWVWTPSQAPDQSNHKQSSLSSLTVRRHPLPASDGGRKQAGYLLRVIYLLRRKCDGVRSCTARGAMAPASRPRTYQDLVSTITPVPPDYWRSRGEGIWNKTLPPTKQCGESLDFLVHQFAKIG
jgi:hypothetical protein